MRISDILEECLEKDDNFSKMNKVEKLAAKTLIQRALGSDNTEVPDEEVPNVRAQLQFLITNTGITSSP